MTTTSRSSSPSSSHGDESDEGEDNVGQRESNREEDAKCLSSSSCDSSRMKQPSKDPPDDEKMVAHRILKQLVISSCSTPSTISDSLVKKKQIVVIQRDDGSQENEQDSRVHSSHDGIDRGSAPQPDEASMSGTFDVDHHREPFIHSTIPPPSPLEGRATTPGAVSIVLRQASSHSSQSRISSSNSSSSNNNSSHNEDGPTDPTTTVPVTAELVNQDYERQLEEEVRRLQEQVQQTTPRMSVPLCIQALPIEDGAVSIPLGNAEEEEEDSSNTVNGNRENQDASARRKRIRNMRLVLAAVAVVAVVVAILVVTSISPRDNREDPTYWGSSRREEGMDIIYSDPRFSKFRNSLISSGVLSDPRWHVKDRPPMNILAPTNEAFERYFPEQYLYQTPGGVAHLKTMLECHIYQGSKANETLQDGDTLTTLGGETILASVENHDNDQHISFEPALDASKLNVTEPPILATNGDTVHVIDGLVMPNFYKVDLFDVVVALNLTHAAEWMGRGSLEGVSRESNDFTLFIPSNEAFEALAPETRQAMEASYDFMMLVLVSHVSPSLYPTKLLREEKITQIEGLTDGTYLYLGYPDQQAITIGLENGMKANIILADQLSRNGIFHVIDRILVPGN